jgi:hypothetical protein
LVKPPHNFAKRPRPKMAQQLCWLRLLWGCCVRNEQQPMAQDASPKAQAATGGSRCVAEAQAATDGSRCLAEARAATDGSRCYAEAQKRRLDETPLKPPPPLFETPLNSKHQKLEKLHCACRLLCKGTEGSVRWLQRFTHWLHQATLAPKGDVGSKLTHVLAQLLKQYKPQVGPTTDINSIMKSSTATDFTMKVMPKHWCSQSVLCMLKRVMNTQSHVWQAVAGLMPGKAQVLLELASFVILQSSVEPSTTPAAHHRRGGSAPNLRSPIPG